MFPHVLSFIASTALMVCVCVCVGVMASELNVRLVKTARRDVTASLWLALLAVFVVDFLVLLCVNANLVLVCNTYVPSTSAICTRSKSARWEGLSGFVVLDYVLLDPTLKAWGFLYGMLWFWLLPLPFLHSEWARGLWIFEALLAQEEFFRTEHFEGWQVSRMLSASCVAVVSACVGQSVHDSWRRRQQGCGHNTKVVLSTQVKHPGWRDNNTKIVLSTQVKHPGWRDKHVLAVVFVKCGNNVLRFPRVRQIIATYLLPVGLQRHHVASVALNTAWKLGHSWPTSIHSTHGIPCRSWRGVKVMGAFGKVEFLRLPDQQLRGAFPNSIAKQQQGTARTASSRFAFKKMGPIYGEKIVDFFI